MKVDIEALETYNRLANEGAEQAGSSLTQLTGIDARVDVTETALLSRGDVKEQFEGKEFVGVQIGFEGEIAGKTVLAFDRETVQVIVNHLVPGAENGEIDGMAQSGIEELGNIMLGGFIDGWANHLGTAIDMTTPNYVERSGSAILPDDTLNAAPAEHVFLFKSCMELVDEEVDFLLYMLPETEMLAKVMAKSDTADDEAIPIDKLSVFNYMTRRGAEQVAQNITAMTGIQTDVDVTQLAFVPLPDVPAQVGDTEYTGVVVQFDGLPSGYLAILFDRESTRSVVEAMVPTDSGGDGLDEMGESAIKEIGNIMTSGFIDGWANVLETSIDHSPPQFVHDMGSAVMSPVVGRLGQSQEYAFLIDSTIRTDDETVSCEIFALPNEDELKRALQSIAVERADEIHADAEQLF